MLPWQGNSVPSSVSEGDCGAVDITGRGGEGEGEAARHPGLNFRGRGGGPGGKRDKGADEGERRREGTPVPREKMPSWSTAQEILGLWVDTEDLPLSAWANTRYARIKKWLLVAGGCYTRLLEGHCHNVT